jgi:hypothetical protein
MKKKRMDKRKKDRRDIPRTKSKMRQLFDITFDCARAMDKKEDKRIQ